MGQWDTGYLQAAILSRDKNGRAMLHPYLNKVTYLFEPGAQHHYSK